ncbi:GNAT family N-acetyltransferase [Haloarcula nitratireducens]|uniref:GNAT family N-acetyltransferase n=1 Tax=Haloarcula nitratireducens TaxID=2487749 RepID=A0AAW4PEF4_9EURY|nr:GNAT family N-acetyltransferase [Halomicroarcula nitratireducens]MBX0296204.1 GNAT family N-acetyltransferase [Halomicroarcula nitratireducens]
MNVRPATVDDREGIRETAERSFRASYALSPQHIETIIETDFGPEELSDRIDTNGERLLVAEGGDDEAVETSPVGFAELTDAGELRWLHVHPEARGRGIGHSLVEGLQDELDGDSARLTARLLESAREGNQFLQRFDLYQTDTETIEIGSVEFTLQRYTQQEEERIQEEKEDEEAGDPEVEVPDEVTFDGQQRSVDSDSELSGTRSPFFPVYDDAESEHRAGYFCSQCGGTDVTGDGLDRLKCNECGNTHRPDDWDPAYL